MFGDVKIKKPVVAGVTIFIISFWMLILGGCFRNILVLGIGFGVIMAEAITVILWQINKLDWQCNQCGTIFTITWKQNITGVNGGSVKELYCPHCGKKTWCDPVRKQSDKNNNTDTIGKVN